jgi:membrane-associated phospholipid phosphatase
MNIKRITYALLPFLLVATLLFVAYWGNQWYAETFGNPGVDYSFIFLNFNNNVPFLSWTIYPYTIAYPFWIGSFFYIAYRSKKNMYTLLAVIVVTFTLSGLFYFFFQSEVQAWRETSGLFGRADLNFTESFVMTIYNAAGPRNALPSFHCLMSWLCIIGARMDKKMPLVAKIVIWTLGLAICISTQTLKQHYIIDLIAALALGEAFYWILRKSKMVDWLQNQFTKINIKWNLEWDESIK